MSLIFIALITSCNTHKKNIINDINNNDDYKIINLLFNKYSDTVFYNDAKTLFIVYEDSMMLNNRFRTTKEDKQKNVDEVFYKYIDKNKIQNKKFVVVSNDEYNYKIDYPKTPFNSKPDKHKFVIKELYYNDTKTEAFLNYCEVVYTPIYGTVWNNTCYEMRYKKENGKWIELGNFNRKLN
ncbi:hypothetical protein [Flavobacterium sp.]|uniref:hypothetical protein n=1 Tax=Flavobacterium sp. TaxID=239 RepID=UPI002614FBE8|nr:hypothetical protein [Flavobacterium sp.]